MTVQKLTQLFFICSLVLVTACAASTRSENIPISTAELNQPPIWYGSVSHIESLPRERRNTGGSVMAGAVQGTVIGYRLAGSSDRATATSLGMVGGALIGNELARRHDNQLDIYRIRVRLENGSSQQFDYQRIDNLQVGDRVRIQGGQLYRD